MGRSIGGSVDPGGGVGVMVGWLNSFIVLKGKTDSSKEMSVLITVECVDTFHNLYPFVEAP